MFTKSCLKFKPWPSRCWGPPLWSFQGGFQLAWLASPQMADGIQKKFQMTPNTIPNKSTQMAGVAEKMLQMNTYTIPNNTY